MTNAYKPEKNKYRQPSDHALASALTGAISIVTPDGNNIVITPRLARSLAKNLESLATLAEGMIDQQPVPYTLTPKGKAAVPHDH